MNGNTRFKITHISPITGGTSPDKVPPTIGVPSPLEDTLSKQIARVAEEIEVDLEKVIHDLEERLEQLDKLFDVIARNVRQMELSEVEVELNITSEGSVSVAPWGIGASGSLGAGGTLRITFEPKKPTQQATP